MNVRVWSVQRGQRSSPSGVVHALPDIIEGTIVFLSVDTPRRDPRDIIFVNPADGTPESFIRDSRSIELQTVTAGTDCAAST